MNFFSCNFPFISISRFFFHSFNILLLAGFIGGAFLLSSSLLFAQEISDDQTITTGSTIGSSAKASPPLLPQSTNEDENEDGADADLPRQLFEEFNQGTQRVHRSFRPWKQDNLRFGLYTGKMRVPLEFFSDLTLQPHLEMFIENYYEHGVYQLPAMGGYSYPDNYVFSLLGNSWLWNRYRFHGLSINDTFSTGYTLHKMPMYSRDVDIDPIRGELDFLNVHNENELYLSGSTGYLGANIPYYKVFKDPYSQQSPQLRERAPTELRRRNRFTLEGFSKNVLRLGAGTGTSAGAGTDTSKGEGAIWFDTYLNIRDRLNNEFDEFGNAKSYNETFMQVSFNGQWVPRYGDNGNQRAGWLATFLTRNAWGSEFYFARQETARLDDFAVSGYYLNEGEGEGKLSHGHILNLNYKGITRLNDNFSRNIFDLDGEGLDPFFPSADVYALSEHSYVRYDFGVLNEDFLVVRGDAINHVAVVSPKSASYANPVYFKSPTDTLALYVTEWEARPLAYMLLDNSVELSLNKDDDDGFQVYGSAGATLSGVLLNRESFARVRPKFSLGMNVLNGYHGGARQQLRVEVGRVNISFDSKLALFVSDLYNRGKNYVWNDLNGNLAVDANEQTADIHSTTGGAYRHLDPNLNQPHYYYLDIPYNVDFNENWSLSIAGHYRIFKDQLWVRLREKSGTTVSTNGQDVYVPNQGEKNFVVYNLSADKFPGNPNWFNDSPFYAGIATKVTAVGDWYYFAISFAAYLVNGITTLGNGPLHNSQGTLSELMADPNAEIRNVGRLDADRAYLGKLLLAFRFIPELITVVDFKYRDGQPIGQWNYELHPNEKQVSFTRNSVSGDNILLYKGEFGTREDAIMSLDVRVKYTITLVDDSEESTPQYLELGLNLYNLIDMGRELVEFSFFKGGTDTNRNALELQVPRGIEFNVRYIY